MSDATFERPALILGGTRVSDINDIVAAPSERPTSRLWKISFTIAVILMLFGVGMISMTVFFGVGVWGVNQPVGWGWDIVNFVFWVGIGHAGTLISAILFLLKQKWRMAVNRFAEAMTIFAVMCAGLFPLLHTGRQYLAYWLTPYPNQMNMWVNFRSPLLWDVFAVSTYFTVSLMFWYVGLIPDLASYRDRAKNRIRKLLYGIFALGWRGSHRQWNHYESTYMMLAGFATPLVLSVHTVVSFDFATSVIPGWHTTIFPPYFVAGAIFSGFALVVTLMIIARQFFGLKNIVTMHHLENMNKVIMATGLMVGYAYGMEFFTAWYSGNQYETFAFVNRAFGPYAWAYWIMITCNALIPQVFWWKKARTSIPIMFAVSIFVNIGMWFERFVITVTSLHRDFLPSSWGYYKPTLVDAGVFLGSIGIFFTLFLLFCRWMPVIAMAEVKGIMPGAQPTHKDGGHGHE